MEFCDMINATVCETEPQPCIRHDNPLNVLKETSNLMIKPFGKNGSMTHYLVYQTSPVPPSQKCEILFNLKIELSSNSVTVVAEGDIVAMRSQGGLCRRVDVMSVCSSGVHGTAGFIDSKLIYDYTEKYPMYQMSWLNPETVVTEVQHATYSGGEIACTLKYDRKSQGILVKYYDKNINVLKKGLLLMAGVKYGYIERHIYNLLMPIQLAYLMTVTNFTAAERFGFSSWRIRFAIKNFERHLFAEFICAISGQLIAVCEVSEPHGSEFSMDFRDVEGNPIFSATCDCQQITKIFNTEKCLQGHHCGSTSEFYINYIKVFYETRGAPGYHNGYTVRKTCGNDIAAFYRLETEGSSVFLKNSIHLDVEEKRLIMAATMAAIVVRFKLNEDIQLPSVKEYPYKP